MLQVKLKTLHLTFWLKSGMGTSKVSVESGTYKAVVNDCHGTCQV